MYHPIEKKQIAKKMIDELSSIITSKSLNLCMKLSEDICFELLNNMFDLRFVVKGENPSESSICHPQSTNST